MSQTNTIGPGVSRDNAEGIAELAAEFGNVQNVEQLIRAHRARRDRDLQAATMLDVNQKATDDLDLDKVDEALGKSLTLVRDGGGRPAAVHGDTVVAIGRDAVGRTHKVALKQGARGALKATEDPVAREADAKDTGSGADVADLQAQIDALKAATDAATQRAADAERAAEEQKKAAEQAEAQAKEALEALEEARKEAEKVDKGEGPQTPAAKGKAK